jgi:hypothetical protein
LLLLRLSGGVKGAGVAIIGHISTVIIHMDTMGLNLILSRSITILMIGIGVIAKK